MPEGIALVQLNRLQFLQLLDHIVPSLKEVIQFICLSHALNEIC